MSKKFLICQLASFGDCLYATTLAKQIKHDYPTSHITWAISTRYKSILDNNPYVDAIWEIPTSYGDIFTEAWERVVREAIDKKECGEFDEIILSQTSPRWTHFNGTLRGTILSTYKKPITVSPKPILVLSKEEIDRVTRFRERHNLSLYKNIILFECAPTSGQSKDVTISFAADLSRKIITKEPDTCIILSSPKRLETGDKRIIDASELTFRENAELANHCTLFIGCSSGITWLLTSEGVSPLPMIELLDKDYAIFYGVKYDHEVQHLSHDHIMEIMTFSEEKILDAVLLTLKGKWDEATRKYNEDYRVTYQSFRRMIIVFLKYKHPFAGIPMLFRYRNVHSHLSGLFLLMHLFYAYVEFFGLAVKRIWKLSRS